MKAKAPDIRRSNVDTNSLIIVGIDVEVNDENRDYLDEAVDDRVLSSNAAYNAASDEEKREWDDFLESIATNGLLQPPIVDVNEEDGEFFCYVVDGRRRVAAMKQLLGRATAAGDEAAIKKFSRTSVTTVPLGLSRTDVALIANQYRKGLSVEQQIRVAALLRDSGVDKEEIAKRLNCSPNHTDKLYRRAKSIDGLRLAIVHGEVDIREGDELTWCYDDHELQSKAFNIYMKWRAANYCSKRSPGYYKMAQKFHSFVKEMGIDAVVDQLNNDINVWLYGETDKASVPTIDGGLADGSGGDSVKSAPSSSGGGGGGGSLDSLPLDDSGSSDGGDSTPPADSTAADSTPPADDSTPVTTRVSVGFKLTNGDIRNLLNGNYRGIRYADGLNQQTRALLELIVLGKAPEKVNVHTKPLLRFLAWEDGFEEEFKRTYGAATWDSITEEMDAEEVPNRK